MKDVWKWLAVTALAICLGVGVTAVVQSASAQTTASACLSMAETNTEKKISKERAAEKFAGFVTVELIKKDIETIKGTQSEQAETMKVILAEVRKLRR